MEFYFNAVSCGEYESSPEAKICSIHSRNLISKHYLKLPQIKIKSLISVPRIIPQKELIDQYDAYY